MESAINILKKSKLFSNLADNDLAGLREVMETRTVQAGETLTNQGDTATFFFVLHTGTILVALQDGKSVVMKMPGDLIGLELLSSKGIYTATLTALTSCEIAVIPRDAFLTFIQDDSPAAETFMQSWGRHLALIYPFITEQNLPDEDYHY